jgi:creatinine amidohydrolase
MNAAVRVLIPLWLFATAGSTLPAQRPQSVFLEDYTWPELRDAIAAGASTVLVYSGSVEESGPHLVLGKHNLRARAYAERIARALDHTLVAPIIPAAPTGAELMRFPGTLDVRPDVFAAYIADIVRSLARAGFKTVFLLGDHAGDQAPLRALAPRLDAELAPRAGGGRTRVYFVGDGFAKAATEIYGLAASRHLRGAGHGGLDDTAELWALAPEGVRPDLFAAGDTSSSDALDARGVSGDPRAATPDLGREFSEIRVRNAVAQIRALLDSARSR